MLDTSTSLGDTLACHPLVIKTIHIILTLISQQPQAMAGFGQETKYSAQQGFHQVKNTSFFAFFLMGETR